MDELTKYLAIWGATVSTIALAWNIRNSLKDRGSLKVSAEKKQISRERLEKSNDHIHKVILNKLAITDETVSRLRITAFNTGKRPIILSEVDVMYQRNIDNYGENDLERLMRLKYRLPIKIDAGDFAHLEYAWGIVNSELNGVVLCTACGNNYSLPYRDLIALREEC